MGVTRGRLPQRAGSLGLNAGGVVAAVPPHHNISSCTVISDSKCEWCGWLDQSPPI